MLKYSFSVVEVYSKVTAIFVACAAVGVVCVFLWSTNVHTAKTEHFFSEALRQAHVREGVLVNGEHVLVVRDDVIAVDGTKRTGAVAHAARILAYKKALARYAPLFALPGIDPVRLGVASGVLHDTQEALASIQKTKRDAYLVQTALYPTTFLERLADLEEARRSFLTSGSEYDARRYEMTLYDALQEYKNSLVRFRLAFEKATPVRIRDYATVQTIVSRDGMTNILTALLARAHDMEITMRRRGLCTSGIIGACDTGDIVPTLLSITPDMHAIADTRTAEEVRNMYAKAGYLVHIPGEEAMVQLMSSYCNENEIPLFVTNQISTWRGVSYRSVLPINNIRFVRSAEYTDVPFFAYFNAHEVTYVPATITSYTCLELGSDRGHVLGTLAVRSFAHSARASAFLSGERAKRLQRLEQMLSAPTVKEQDAREYLNILMQERESLPLVIAQGAASLALEMRLATAGFEDGVFEVAREQDVNVRLTDAGPKADLDLPYLFFVRSNALSFFLALHGVTISPDDFFERNTAQRDDMPYVWYSSLHNEPSEVARILHDMTFYRKTFAEEL